MSQNVRVVLILVLLVGGVGLIAYFATQDPGVDPDTGPSDLNEDEILEPPPIAIGKPGAVTGEVRIFRTSAPAEGVEVRIEGAGDPIVRKTGEGGVFVASVPSGPPVTVTVVAPRPLANVVVRGVTVKPDQTTSLGTLYLERALLVRGIVVDGAGRPIAGANVRAYRPSIDDSPAQDFLQTFVDLTKARPSIDSAVTNGGGEFVLSQLSPGTYRIEAESEGFAVGAIARVIVSPELEVVEHRIILSPGHKLTGTVTTADKIPVEKAVVTVFRFKMTRDEIDFSPVETVTDENGQFRFGNLAPGQGSISVRAEGYPTTMVNNVGIGQESNVEIVLGGTATLEGRITSESGDPIEGADVAVAVGQRRGALANTVSDANGSYRVEHLPADRLQFIRVRAAGYATYPVIDNPMMFQRGFGKLEEGRTLTKDITLSSGANVAGRITSAVDAKPVVGASVYILSGLSMFLGSAGQGVTDENGEYRISGVAKGLYQVVVKATGYYQTGLDPRFAQRAFGFGGRATTKEGSPEVQVKEGDAEKRLDLTLERGAIAVGTVVAPDDSPVAGARVSVVKPDQGNWFNGGGLRTTPPPVLTDESGHFRLAGLPAGAQVKFEAEADEWVRGESEPVALQAGQETTGIVVRLRAGGSISGSITSHLGGALVGAEIRAMIQPAGATGNPWSYEWQLQNEVPVLTDEQGAFKIENLVPGKYVLRAGAKDHRAQTRLDLTVAEGEDGGPIDLRLEPGLKISGFVRSESGTPISGVNVWATFNQPGGSNATGGRTFQTANTDDDGKFVLDQLDPGAYNLRVNSADYADRTFETVRAGTEDFEIVLEKGKEISGRVLLPDGTPAPQVWVSAASEDGSNGNDRTNDAGEFTIENLPPGAYRVSVNLGGFRPQADDDGPSILPAVLESIEAGSRNLELRLRAGATIEGRVTDDAGQPIAGANVWASEKDAQGQPTSGYGRTDEDGRFRLTGLEPGRKFAVRANMAGYGMGPETVVSADTTGVTIVLPPVTPQPEVEEPPK